MWKFKMMINEEMRMKTMVKMGSEKMVAVVFGAVGFEKCREPTVQDNGKLTLKASIALINFLFFFFYSSALSLCEVTIYE